jgi:hypothetical protein
MVDAVNNEAADTSTDTTGADDAGAEEAVNWQERAVAAEKKLVKEQAIRKEAQAAAKKAKSGVDEDGTNYKKLYESSEAKASKILEKAKRSDINAAASSQLSKLGVTPDAQEAALKLLDINGIEWDEDDGADATSVKAAVQTLKNQFPFMFEKKVTATTVKTPAGGKNLGAEENTMDRASFDRLTPREKTAAIAKGMKIVE